MKYAKIDSTKSGSQPVLGWFDTDISDYPNEDFTTADFVEMTDTQWGARQGNPYYDPSNNTFGKPPAPTTAERLADAKQAKMAEIQASADAAMAAPISFTNAAGTQATFPMDQNSWLKYLASYTRYVVHGKALPSNGVSFMDVQGNPIPMTVADIDSFSDPVFNQIETVEQKAAGLYSQINAVTTSTSSPITTVQAIKY